MSPTDPSLFIAVVLGCAAAAVAIGARIFARRPRYQAPPSEPYAGFRTGARAHVGGGQLVLLECEGHCDGATAHETDGDGGATCVLCGTTRPAPAPDTA